MGEKRCREDEDVVLVVGPALKRQQREDDSSHEEEDEQLFDDETHRGLVSDVMKSLEEELVGISSCSASSTDEEDDEREFAAVLEAVSSSPSPSSSSQSREHRLDFGFLLEASDDELGIEPATRCEEEEEEHEEEVRAVVEADDLVRGESWSDGDWSVACSSLPDALFVEEQDWLWKRMIFSSSCSSVAILEAATPLLIL